MKKRTIKHDRAIEALLAAPTFEQAAKQAEVSESTLRRYLDNQDFQQEFLKARRLVFGQAIAKLQTLSMKAAKTLEKLLDNPKTPSHVLVTTARTVLEMGRQGIQDDDVLERIEKLETLLGEQSNESETED